MGFDPRIASALLTLGYDVFPFEAFDQAGRVRIPDGVRYPEHVKDGLARVATAPAWAEIFRTLSVLDDRQWGVYMAGVGFGPRTLNVAVFRSVTSVSGPAAAHQWSVSYQTTVATSLRQFAGRRHPIDPTWLGYVDEALDRLEQQGVTADAARPAAPPGQVRDGSAVGSDEVVELAAPSWLLLGLRFLSGLFSRLTVTTEIRTTVFWFPPQDHPRLDVGFGGSWTPLHVDYMYDGSIRSVHATWDPRIPKLVRGKDVPWGRWLWAMPHELWQWCRAFYPTRSCGGPGLASAGELVWAETPASAPVDPALVDGLLASNPARPDVSSRPR